MIIAVNGLAASKDESTGPVAAGVQSDEIRKLLFIGQLAALTSAL